MEKEYLIKIHGCDDSTIFKMNLDENEVALIERIGIRSSEISTCGCMPVLSIEPIKTKQVCNSWGVSGKHF